jgi:hypothetical protein
MKLLLFVTTHLSAEHLLFLSACWPTMLSQPALRRAHLHFFVTANGACSPRPTLGWTSCLLRNGSFDTRRNVQSVRNLFPNASFAVHRVDSSGDNHGKQAGAIASIMDRASKQLFASYDWVIRLNPDVILYDAQAIVSLMIDSRDAVLVECTRQSGGAWKGPVVMTDLTVFRPHALVRDEDAPCAGTCESHMRPYCDTSLGLNVSRCLANAEHNLTRMLVSTLESGRYAWLWRSHDATCRVRDPRVAVHEHSTKRCLIASESWMARASGHNSATDINPRSSTSRSTGGVSSSAEPWTVAEKATLLTNNAEALLQAGNARLAAGDMRLAQSFFTRAAAAGELAASRFEH